jgi:hypothetical protein
MLFTAHEQRGRRIIVSAITILDVFGWHIFGRGGSFEAGQDGRVLRCVFGKA